MGKHFTDKAVGQMPSVAGLGLFDMGPFRQLPDDGLHQAPDVVTLNRTHFEMS